MLTDKGGTALLKLPDVLMGIRRTYRISLIILIAALTSVIIISCTDRKVLAREELTGRSSEEIVSKMGLGWNLGNTFDATGGNRSNIYSQETSWGNPKVTRELIQAISKRGFKTIRIPVTWMNHIDKNNNYTINPEFLARVKEVVDYAYELDMFIILNAHHESWINTPKIGETPSSDDTGYMAIGKELAAVWGQIADYFADYDQHLIFEGMNEPRMQGTAVEWSGNRDAYEGVNYLNQVFTYTVRNNGKGLNSERCLMIPGYAASSNTDVLKTITIPTFDGDPVKNLIVSIHCYSPYDFCLSDNLDDFYPDDKNLTSSIDNVFTAAEELFLFNDVPVVIGETGATNTNDNTEARERWAAYMGQKSSEYGIPIIIWDNGSYGTSNGERHAWINRRSCEWNYPTVVDSLFEGAGKSEWGSLTAKHKASYVDENINTSVIGGSTIWENSEGVRVSSDPLGNALRFQYLRNYIIGNAEVAILYSGNSVPRIDLSDGENDTTATGIFPDRIENYGDKHIAYYKYITIYKIIDSSEIFSLNSIKEMSVCSSGESITLYEISTVMNDSSVTYIVNGEETDGSLQEVPVLPGLKFLGWYTTKTYRDGTAFTGKAGRNLTVYAKFALAADAGADPYVPVLPDPTPTPTPVPTAVPTSTPTPVPTVTPTPEATPEPTVTPTPVVTTEPTSTPEADVTSVPDNGAGKGDSSDKADSSDSSEGNTKTILIIVFSALGTFIIGMGSFFLIKRKK